MTKQKTKALKKSVKTFTSKNVPKGKRKIYKAIEKPLKKLILKLIK